MTRRASWTLALFLVILVVGTGWVFHSGFEQSRQLNLLNAKADAQKYADAVAKFRDFYARHILPRAQDSGMTASHFYHNTSGTLPLPATFVIDFGDFSQQGSGYDVNLLSDLPFPWREPVVLDDFETQALSYLRQNPQEDYWLIEQQGQQNVLRFARADVLKGSCVGCHNTYPGTPKTDWKTGDVRGILVVSRPVADYDQAIGNQMRSSFIQFLLLLFVLAMGLVYFFRQYLRSVATIEQSNADLAQAKDKAEEASRVKTEFLTNITHELRTPLNGISGSSSLLSQLPLNEEAKTLNENIELSARQLQSLVDNVLNFSQLDGHQHAIVNQRMNAFEAWLDDLVAPLLADAEQKKLQIQCDCQAMPAFIEIDADKLKTVMHHLLDNAIKFSPADQQATIDIRISQQPWPDDGIDALCISITDQGCGIQSGVLNRIFDAFSQADGSLTREMSGLGIGLSICQKILTLLDGRLEVISEAGKGSTFTVWIPFHGQWHQPYARKRKRYTAHPPLAQQDSHTWATYPNAKVLVVEDNVTNQKVIAAMLKKCQVQVDIANNGEEGLQCLKQSSYDLVLMDIQMPVKDGYQATLEWRAYEKQHHQTPVTIVAVTAQALEQDRLHVMDVGMDAYYTKPLQFHLIQNILQTWLPRISHSLMKYPG